MFMPFNVFVQSFFSAAELVLKLMHVVCGIYSNFILEGVCRDY